VSHPSRTTTAVTAGYRMQAYDHPTRGTVLQAVLSGRQDPDFWIDVRTMLREEIARRPPQYLVFDLQALEGSVGSAFLGALVAGADEMKKHGMRGRTRIVASGAIARKLASVLSVSGLQPILGDIHPDVESALADGP